MKCRVEAPTPSPGRPHLPQGGKELREDVGGHRQEVRLEPVPPPRREVGRRHELLRDVEQEAQPQRHPARAPWEGQAGLDQNRGGGVLECPGVPGQALPLRVEN